MCTRGPQHSSSHICLFICSRISLPFCPGPGLVPVHPNQDLPILDNKERTEKCVDGDVGNNGSRGKVSGCPPSEEERKEGKEEVTRKRNNFMSRRSALSPLNLPTERPLNPHLSLSHLSPSHTTTATPACLVCSKGALSWEFGFATQSNK